jgi:hypothetical protein
VKAVLNPRKHLGIASEDIDNVRICLLDEAYGSGHNGGPSSEARSVVRRAEKDNTAGETKDIVEVLLRSLPRREQSILADQPSQAMAYEYDRSFIRAIIVSI